MIILLAWRFKMKNFREILKKDKALKEEVDELLESGRNLPIARRNSVSISALTKAMVGPANELPRAEAMIQIHLRPALLIRRNKIETPDSAEVRKRLLPYIPKLESRVPSVGRIEFRWIGRAFGGTCWMVAEDLIVTNRHVAQLMTRKTGRTITFLRNGLGDPVQGFVDFKEEYVGENIARPQFE